MVRTVTVVVCLLLASPLYAQSKDCSRTTLYVSPDGLSYSFTPVEGFSPAPHATYAPSPESLAAGQAMAESLQPINGKIVILGIGMSTAYDMFGKLDDVLYSPSTQLKYTDLYPVGTGGTTKGTPDRRPGVVFINGALDSHTVSYWDETTDNGWSHALDVLALAGYQPSDVQILVGVFTEKFPDTNGEMTEAQFRGTITSAKTLLPNLRSVRASGHPMTNYTLQARVPAINAYRDTLHLASWIMAGGFPEDVHVAFDDLWTNGDPWVCGRFKIDGTHTTAEGNWAGAYTWRDLWRVDPTIAPALFVQ